MFEDEQTRRIMRTLAKESPIHLRGLMYKTQIHQNPLYVRLHKLIKARFVRENYVGNQRQFEVTKKGVQAIYQDGAGQGREFVAFLRETAQGPKLLEMLRDLQDTKEHDGLFIRVLLSSLMLHKMTMIDERLGILRSEGQHIDGDLIGRVRQLVDYVIDMEKKANAGDIAGQMAGLDVTFRHVVDLAQDINEKFKVDILNPGPWWRDPPRKRPKSDWRIPRSRRVPSIYRALAQAHSSG